MSFTFHVQIVEGAEPVEVKMTLLRADMHYLDLEFDSVRINPTEDWRPFTEEDDDAVGVL